MDRDPNASAAVVTGATSGIGREIARRLAVEGRRTVVVGRGSERTATVAQSLREETRNPSVDAVAVTDLAVLSEVRALARELLDRYSRIDLLVNNAGAVFLRREVTSEGLERTFALNVLSPFLLSSLLSERMVTSSPARIVNVASAAHRGYSVDFDDLQGTRTYRGFAAYGRSKLELILLTREFARRLGGTGVSTNAVHPGFVRTGFGQNNGRVAAGTIRVLARLFGKSVHRGAVTPYFVATDPSVGGTSGEYFSNRQVSAGSVQSRDAASARRLYEVCRELTRAPELRSVAPVASPSAAGS